VKKPDLLRAAFQPMKNYSGTIFRNRKRKGEDYNLGYSWILLKYPIRGNGGGTNKSVCRGIREAGPNRETLLRVIITSEHKKKRWGDQSRKK